MEQEALAVVEILPSRSAQESPEKAHESVRVRAAIEEGLGRMVEARRNAVLLYLQGFSLEESARLLGWSTKQVDNRRYQGLAELRSFLEQRGMKP